MYFSWGVCKNQCSRDRASFRHCAGNESGRHRRVCVNVLYATPWVLARLKRIASTLVRPSNEPGYEPGLRFPPRPGTAEM